MSGRALVQVFLFDEPLSNLDAAARADARRDQAMHQHRHHHCHHDQVEAMTMADKIVVLHDGVIEQIGAARLYGNPANLFVAGFIGSPAMNFIRGRVASSAPQRPQRSRLSASSAA